MKKEKLACTGITIELKLIFLKFINPYEWFINNSNGD